MADPDPRASAQDAAASWIARRSAGCDLADDARFTRWLEASPANRAAWDSAERLWGSFDGNPDPMLAAMHQVAQEARPDRRRPLLTWGGAMAAAMAMAFLGYTHLAPRQMDTPSAPLAQTYTAPAGKLVTVRLADGSYATLAGGTRLWAHIGPDMRLLRLDRGQAFIQVQHDARRPLTATANGLQVTDIGTEFDLMTLPAGARVVLLHGRIAASSASQQAELVPGQLAQTRGGDLSVATAANPGQLLSWRTGQLDFEGKTVGEAVDTMNHYAEHAIILTDPSTRALPISGHYPIDHAERFASALATLYRLRMTRNPGGDIVLRPRSHPSG